MPSNVVEAKNLTAGMTIRAPTSVDCFDGDRVLILATEYLVTTKLVGEKLELQELLEIQFRTADGKTSRAEVYPSLHITLMAPFSIPEATGE